MRRVKRGARAPSVGRFVVAGLVLLGAVGAAVPARADDAVPSAYSLATASATIGFNTGPDPKSGAVKLNAETALPAPDKIEVRCETETGLAPGAVSVAFDVTYNGMPGHYVVDEEWKAIKKGKDGYAVPLTTFARRLLADINTMLPLNFDPNAAPAFSTSVDVEVTVTPIDQDNKPGNPRKAKETLKLTLQPVLGDLKAWAESEARKPPEKSPEKSAGDSTEKPAEKTPGKSAAGPPARRTASWATAHIPMRCPFCWTDDDSVAYRAHAMGDSASSHAIAPACSTMMPAVVADGTYVPRPFHDRSEVNRTCWP